jgi:hypothetical protein
MAQDRGGMSSMQNGHRKQIACDGQWFDVLEKLLLLLGGLLALFQAGVTGGGKLVLKLLNATCRVDELQLARVKRVASAADIDLEFFARASRRKAIAATAGDFGFYVFGMDVSLHGKGILTR